MAVHVTHKEPVVTPVDTVKLSLAHATREIVVRPCTSRHDLLTVVCTHYGNHWPTEFKAAATRSDLRAFGEALIRIADGA